LSAGVCTALSSDFFFVAMMLERKMKGRGKRTCALGGPIVSWSISMPQHARMRS
jgi:hypothetical protein